MSGKYTEVTAITSLPTSHYLYEANIDLECAGCGATIPVNSYFARKKATKYDKHPLLHCRQCRPFKVYTNPFRVDVAPRDEEYLYVTDRKESEEI